jgi:hypothetical protein
MKVVKERDVPIGMRVEKPAPVEPKKSTPPEDKVIAAIDRLIAAVQALQPVEEEEPEAPPDPQLAAIAEQIGKLAEQMSKPQPTPVVQTITQPLGYRFEVHYDKLGNIEYVDASRRLDN